MVIPLVAQSPLPDGSMSFDLSLPGMDGYIIASQQVLDGPAGTRPRLLTERLFDTYGPSDVWTSQMRGDITDDAALEQAAALVAYFGSASHDGPLVHLTWASPTDLVDERRIFSKLGYRPLPLSNRAQERYGDEPIIYRLYGMSD